MPFSFHPFQVFHRPGLYPHRRSPAMPQQKLIQPMPCSKFILRGGSATARGGRCKVTYEVCDFRRSSFPKNDRVVSCVRNLVTCDLWHPALNLAERRIRVEGGLVRREAA